MTRLPSLTLLALAAAALSQPASACGPEDACKDVLSTLAGSIEVSTIVVSWETNDEDASIKEYRLYRYNCPQRTTCTEYVTTEMPTGSCGSTASYSYTDHPGLPLTQWRYYVEVFVEGGFGGTYGTRVCGAETQPH